MAKTLIRTPFPSTKDVAQTIGVSPARVKRLEKLMKRDSLNGRFTDSTVDKKRTVDHKSSR